MPPPILLFGRVMEERMDSRNETKSQLFLGKLEKREKLLAFFQIFFIVLGFFAFMLPALTAEYNGSYYYVRGIDMVIGRQVVGDKYGMIPQPLMATAAVALAIAVLLWLSRKKERSAFLTTVFCMISTVLVFMVFFEDDAKMAATDPVKKAMLENRYQYGLYLIFLFLLFSTVAGLLRSAAKPAIRTDFMRHKWVYVMAVPVLVYAMIFFYYPLYGLMLAFKDYVPRMGVLGSPWIGMENFVKFFTSPYFERLIRNTIRISSVSLIFDFITPILFALFLNEARSNKFKRVVQTATYLPHFVSLVVICGLLTMFLQREGLINQLLVILGMDQEKAVNWLGRPEYFTLIYVLSNIWQKFGWGSIIYFAAITSIDPQLYEAASVDGAGRFRKMWSVTIPGIMPTIVVMLIMSVGGLMSLGHEKIILLYNPQTYETADVIASYVYRRGIVENDYGFATAVGLFNTVINFALVYFTNRFSRRVSETSLW